VRKLRPGEQYGVQYREPGEIVVEDLGNGKKRVTDKRQKYSVEVPAGWQVEEPKTVDDIFAAHLNGECSVSSGFLPPSAPQDLDQVIRENEEQSLPDLTVKQFHKEDLILSGFAAKRTILESEEFGYTEGIYIATTPIFSASLAVRGTNKEKCVESFHTFIESIRFNI
jgi:hypothetical protein